MADNESRKLQVHGSGTASVRVRPCLLLMKLRIRAAESTMELGLAKLKKQFEAAREWLTPLGATQIDCGEPHFSEHAVPDSVKNLQRFKRPIPGVPASPEKKVTDNPELHAVLTAYWPIDSLRAEEVLIMVDRLKIEATEEPPAEEEPVNLAPGLETQMHYIQAMQASMQDPEPDYKPQFLYISRLSDAQQIQATREAYLKAQAEAEKLAKSLGKRLLEPSFVHPTFNSRTSGNSQRLMKHQRCLELLEDCSYYLQEDEIISDDPRSVEFQVNFSLHYYCE